MSVSREDVEHVAELARLALNDEEIPYFQRQLSAILDEVNKMQLLDTSSVPPTAQVIPQTNVLRPDDVGEVLARDAVLRIAPSHDGAHYRLPGILGGGA